MKRFQATIALLALIVFFAAGAAQGQTREQEQRQPETIRVDTSLVSVPVSVTDRMGRFVTGLTRAEFQVLEDGKLQEIAGFSATEAPFNVALLIDTSRSTRELLGTIRKAARSFIKQLQPQDRVLIVSFDERVNFRHDFTSNRRQLQRAINDVKSSYLTSIYDAITLTINQKLAPINGRKAIVVFSDGVDTWSKQANYDSTLDLVARSGVLVYAVQYNTNNIGGSISSPFRLPGRNFFTPFAAPQQDRLRQEMQRQITAANFLRALATQSGARHLQAESIENSERAFALIADELRHQYTLEYYSNNERRDGGYRAIKVQLGRDDVAIRARQGYRAPKADTDNRETKPPNQSNP
ncbi:MAG TPA: VWA domain-containing protein [Blastocatellia bacterium]